MYVSIFEIVASKTIVEIAGHIAGRSWLVPSDGDVTIKLTVQNYASATMNYVYQLRTK